MANLEDNTAVQVLIKYKTEYLKFNTNNLTRCLRSPKTMYFSGVLNFIMLVTIILVIYISCGKNNVKVITINKVKELPCEDNWLWYRKKCYYLSNKSDTWYNGQKFCNLHNASLAHIDNQEELNFLFLLKGCSYNHWIGLSRTDDNKAWVWTNGTLYNESLFTIKRSSTKNVDHSFLISNGVASKQGNITNHKWICNKIMSI